MKIGAVILVAGVGIPDEEMEKFLEMKRPTIFEQMIVSYQRAGVADIALVTRDGMADKIEQTLHRRGVTFLDIESDSFDLAVLKGLSYLSDTCERIFVGDIRFPFCDYLLVPCRSAFDLIKIIHRLEKHLYKCPELPLQHVPCKVHIFQEAYAHAQLYRLRHHSFHRSCAPRSSSRSLPPLYG